MVLKKLVFVGWIKRVDSLVSIQSIALRLSAFSTYDRVFLHTQVRIRCAWSTLRC